MEIYLVGGAVRDLLLGNLPHEWDYAFSGSVQDFLSSHSDACVVGKSVRVCLWRGKEYMPLAHNSLEEDLLRRDLTINALALDSRGRLYRHPQALQDLQTGLLRPASATALRDDPLRVFRLARFAACWPDFTVHASAYQQMAALPPAALQNIPAERVGRELRRALAAPAPARFFQVLAEGNALRPWFSELESARHIPAGPARWHQHSVFGHTLRVMDATAGDALATWMALCHDLGKIKTAAALLPHHYGHEQRGVELATALAQRLRLPAVFHKAGALAVAEHMKAGIFTRLRPGKRRDLLWHVHNSGLGTAFWRLADADSNSSVSLEAQRQLACLLTVRLPEEWRDKGQESARQLRLLHCHALCELPSTGSPAPVPSSGTAAHPAPTLPDCTAPEGQDAAQDRASTQEGPAELEKPSQRRHATVQDGAAASAQGSLPEQVPAPGRATALQHFLAQAAQRGLQELSQRAGGRHEAARSPQSQRQES